jgi:ParB family chromosome partitioning protein
VAEGLSVRAVEEAVRQRGGGGEDKPAHPDAAPADAAPRLRPPGLLELEELLARHLDTRVKIEMGATKGRVLVEFATLEDLERIYRAMTEPEPASISS